MEMLMLDGKKLGGGPPAVALSKQADIALDAKLVHLKKSIVVRVCYILGILGD